MKKPLSDTGKSKKSKDKTPKKMRHKDPNDEIKI